MASYDVPDFWIPQSSSVTESFSLEHSENLTVFIKRQFKYNIFNLKVLQSFFFSSFFFTI